MRFPQLQAANLTAVTRSLHTVWHRSTTNCTTSQAWTKYVYVSRTGHVNETAAYSRAFNPAAIYRDLQCVDVAVLSELLSHPVILHDRVQSDLLHLQSEVRVVLELADLRILALGVRHRANSFFRNNYARMLLHPPGVERQHTVAELPLDSGDEAPEDSPEEETGDHLPDLQPTLSRDSAYSTSGVAGALSFFRGRGHSASSTTGLPTSRGISIFRTQSLPLQEHSPPTGPTSSTGLLWRLTGLRRRSTERGISQSSEAPQLDVPAPTPPMTPPMSPSSPAHRRRRESTSAPSASPYPCLKHPTPALSFTNYPNYTAGGADVRWTGSGEMEDDGKVWAGPLMYVHPCVPCPRISLTLELGSPHN